MTVQELFRILRDSEEVVIYIKNFVQWSGLTKNIPSSYFDYLIDNIYSISDSGESCIIINLQ